MIRIEKCYLKAPCNSCGADTDITLLIRYKQNSGKYILVEVKE